MPMANLAIDQTTYYARLDELFAVATATVIGFCLLALPVIPIDTRHRWQFASVLAVATVLFLVRYVWLRQRLSVDLRYYFTDIVNPLTVGLLIDISGHFGLYLYFLFFLNLMSSIALLRFRHVMINAVIVGSYSIYLFFIRDAFMLGNSERYIAGGIVLMVLGLSTIFTYELIHEMVSQLSDFELRKLHFIQDVSHELRTPLTVIKATAGLLRDPRWLRRNDKGQTSEEALDHLASAAADLEHITEKLSNTSKKKVAVVDDKS
jgi:signal transduction histidine kinase